MYEVQCGDYNGLFPSAIGCCACECQCLFPSLTYSQLLSSCTWSWIHTTALPFFQCWVVSCSVSIQTQHQQSVIKRWCRAFSDDQQNRVSWARNALEVELFSTHGAASVLDSVLISIYQKDTHDLKKRECTC